MHPIGQALLMVPLRDQYFSSVVSLISLNDWVGDVPVDTIPGPTWATTLGGISAFNPGLYGSGCGYRAPVQNGGTYTLLSRAAVGNTAMTAEFAMKFASFYATIADQNRFWDISWSGDGYGLTVDQTTNRVLFVNGSYTQIPTSLYVTTGRWYQFALVWDLTTFRIFADGVLIYSAASLAGFPGSSTVVTYSPGQCKRGNGHYYSGYLDECRLTVGVARYTADYTPPSAAFPTA